MRKPIIQHDRDWEVLSKLAREDLGAKNDIEVYNILQEYGRHAIPLDAETFAYFWKYSKEKLNRDAPFYYDENLAYVIKHRLEINDEEELDKIVTRIRFAPIIEGGLGEPTAREYFIKHSKGYKECTTEKEKEEYVRKFY